MRRASAEELMAVYDHVKKDLAGLKLPRAVSVMSAVCYLGALELRDLGVSKEDVRSLIEMAFMPEES